MVVMLEVFGALSGELIHSREVDDVTLQKLSVQDLKKEIALTIDLPPLMQRLELDGKARGDGEILSDVLGGHPPTLTLVKDSTKVQEHLVRATTEWNSHSFVTAAVQINGDALRFASSTLKRDRDIVLAAVVNGGHTGESIRFAHQALRYDREVLMTSLRAGGNPLPYTNPAFKKDPEVMLLALKMANARNTPHLHVAPELWHDSVFAMAAKQMNPNLRSFIELYSQPDRNGSLLISPSLLSGRAIWPEVF